MKFGVFLRRSFFLRRKIALIGFFFVALLSFTAVAAPFLTRISPQSLNPVDKLLPPNGKYLFGTDNF